MSAWLQSLDSDQKHNQAGQADYAKYIAAFKAADMHTLADLHGVTKTDLRSVFGVSFGDAR